MPSTAVLVASIAKPELFAEATLMPFIALPDAFTATHSVYDPEQPKL
jgi:hypothetical protein